MKSLESQHLTYVGFRQRVRRYRPSELLPALARMSANLDRQSPTNRVRSDGSDMPWAVSAIARDSLVFGNEFRSSSITPPLAELIHLFNLTDDTPDDPSASALLTPILHEQFLYQESPFEEISRAYALMEAPGLGPLFDWKGLLGIELSEAIRAAFILRVWVAQNDGRYDPATLDLPHSQEIFERAAPRYHIEAVAQALTTTPLQARQATQDAPDLPAALQRWSFNPLVARPLVDLGSAGIWAPQTMLVDRALQPVNLFHRGFAAWGQKFTQGLGERVEAYTGQQLSVLAQPGELFPEFTYDRGRKKSVDWFWRTPRATVLFECKSARMTIGARAGDESLTQVVARSLGKARAQLDESARLIRERVRPFDQFDATLPVVGVAVTFEPFYLANSQLEEYGGPRSIPSLVMSLRELEQWVTLAPETALDKLLTVLDDNRQTWAFGRAIDLEPGGAKNPILEQAWAQYEFIDPTG